MYLYSEKLAQGVHHLPSLMKYVVLKLYKERC